MVFFRIFAPPLSWSVADSPGSGRRNWGSRGYPLSVIPPAKAHLFQNGLIIPHSNSAHQVRVEGWVGGGDGAPVFSRLGHSSLIWRNRFAKTRCVALGCRCAMRGRAALLAIGPPRASGRSDERLTSLFHPRSSSPTWGCDDNARF